MEWEGRGTQKKSEPTPCPTKKARNEKQLENMRQNVQIKRVKMKPSALANKRM